MNFGGFFLGMLFRHAIYSSIREALYSSRRQTRPAAAAAPKRKKQSKAVLASPALAQEQYWQVLGWIDEAVEAYNLCYGSDPTFEETRAYVKKYFNYTLTR